MLVLKSHFRGYLCVVWLCLGSVLQVQDGEHLNNGQCLQFQVHCTHGIGFFHSSKDKTRQNNLRGEPDYNHKAE